MFKEILILSFMIILYIRGRNFVYVIFTYDYSNNFSYNPWLTCPVYKPNKSFMYSAVCLNKKQNDDINIWINYLSLIH